MPSISGICTRDPENCSLNGRNLTVLLPLITGIWCRSSRVRVDGSSQSRGILNGFFCPFADGMSPTFHVIFAVIGMAMPLSAHLSQLEGSATREDAPEVHRG